MDSLALLAYYEIAPYRGSTETLRGRAVAFTGTLRSSGERGKLLLLNDPASTHAFFYEFRVEDVLYAEELTGLALPDGAMVTLVRLWVRKGAVALKIEPFHVEDALSGLHGML